MARVNINLVYDDTEITQDIALKMYDKHVNGIGNWESFQSYLDSPVYRVTTHGDTDEPDYVEITKLDIQEL